MSRGIRITNKEIKYIALFENITGATVKDCIIDEEFDRLIFIVKQGDVGIAIGKKGRNILTLERMTGKKHEVIEFSDDPIRFIKNALRPAKLKEIRLSEKPDGTPIAVVSVEQRDKGIAIGRNGKNAERIRFLAKRYFQIDNVSII